MRSVNLFNVLRADTPRDFGEVSVVDALKTAGALIEIQEIYQDLLERIAFSSPHDLDEKAEISCRKVLKSQAALNILMLIWKEGDLVSDFDLISAGIGRFAKDGEQINVHSLAVNIAEDAGDFERQQKRIKVVVEAAEAVGLIVRSGGPTSRKRPLSASLSLHKLMLALGDAVRSICFEIAGWSSTGEES